MPSTCVHAMHGHACATNGYFVGLSRFFDGSRAVTQIVISDDMRAMNWSSFTKTSLENGIISFPVFANTTIGPPMKKTALMKIVEKISEATAAVANWRKKMGKSFMRMSVRFLMKGLTHGQQLQPVAILEPVGRKVGPVREDVVSHLHVRPTDFQTCLRHSQITKIPALNAVPIVPAA